MTRRDEIFIVLCEYATNHLGNSPSLRDLLSEMRKKGYSMSYTVLYSHMVKLERDRRVERRDGKLLVISSEWIPPENSA